MLHHYSTAAVNPAERFSFWADAVCQSYCAASCEALSDDNFEGGIRLHHFGPVTLSQVHSAPIEYARGKRDLQTDAPEVFYVALTECEAAYVEQDGKRSEQKFGDIVLFDSTRPYTCGFPQGDNQIICAVPRELMLQYLPHANQLAAVTLSASAAMAPLAAAMIRETANLPSGADAAVALRLGTSLLEILALALESGLDSANSQLNTRQQALLKKIKTYLKIHLADSELNLEQVAAAHHISSRTLNRLFATEGTTAIRWLWQSRLMSGYKLLSEKKTDQVSVAALESGFSNFSHFTHAFKKNFGVTPYSLLKQAPQA